MTVFLVRFDGRLDSGHAVGQWALTITGLVASTSGMISTGLLLLGLVSNPVGWAIAAVTGVALVLEIFDFGIIEGAREREVCSIIFLRCLSRDFAKQA